MKDLEKAFIAILKEKIPSNISFTDEIASVLAINYDAAYRRATGTVSFNLKEIVLLSKKFDISLNNLFQVGNPNSFLIQGSDTIKDLKDFNTYFSRLYNELTPLINKKDSSLTFNARELPMFHFFNNSLLIRFKLFVWLAIINTRSFNQRITFDSFVVPYEIKLKALEIGRVYNSLNVTEIWSYSALNDVLQQLIYFHRTRQIDQKDAIEICSALKKELKNIEYKTINGGRLNNNNYSLYSNDIIMMNNSLLLKVKNKMVFAYPYAFLKFFKIEDQKTCQLQEQFIKEQMLYSTPISSSNTRDHASFFNHKYDKINQVLAIINNEETKPVFL